MARFLRLMYLTRMSHIRVNIDDEACAEVMRLMIAKHPSIDPVHPGEILREDVLPALSMSEAAVADALKVSRQTLCDILSETQPVTAEIAVRLGKLFGNGPALWINLQRAYDLAIAQRSVDVSGIPTLDVHLG